MTDVADDLNCQTCRCALDRRITPAGTVDYAHASERPGTQDADHRPVPVPPTVLADAVKACDFCEASAGFVYECSGQPETENAGLRGEWWAACGDCAGLIEARDLSGLASRAADALPARINRWNHIFAVRDQFQATYRRVLDSLRPGRGLLTPDHPLGLWPLDQTGTSKPESDVA